LNEGLGPPFYPEVQDSSFDTVTTPERTYCPRVLRKKARSLTKLALEIRSLSIADDDIAAGRRMFRTKRFRCRKPRLPSSMNSDGNQGGMFQPRIDVEAATVYPQDAAHAITLGRPQNT
jgi:hypothetical protein